MVLCDTTGVSAEDSDVEHPLAERWLMRILVTRQPGEDPPTAWDWDVPGADVIVMSAEVVGLVVPETTPEP